MLLLPRCVPLLPRRAPFSTLTPSKLLPSDWLEISGKSDGRVRYDHAPAASPTCCLNFRHGGALSNGDCRPVFPPRTRGFLYTHTVPGHPAAGEVRLRLVRTADPARFGEGRDLVMASGLPWALPLPMLGGTLKYETLRACLVREGFVRAENFAAWSGQQLNARMQAVHAPGVPFFVDFGACESQVVHVAHGVDIMRVQLMNFASIEAQNVVHPLWSGAAHLAFEYQPSHHAFALRVLRIVSRITPNPLPPRPQGKLGEMRAHALRPTPGALIMRWVGDRDAPQPHLFHVRKPAHHSLRFLLSPAERGALERELGLATGDLVGASDSSITRS